MTSQERSARFAAPAPRSMQLPQPITAQNDEPSTAWDLSLLSPETQAVQQPSVPIEPRKPQHRFRLQKSEPLMAPAPPHPQFRKSAKPAEQKPSEQLPPSVAQMIDNVVSGLLEQSPNSYLAPYRQPPTMWQEITGQGTRDRRTQLIAEYRQLQVDIRSLCKVWTIISVHNTKSAGKSTLAAWLTAVLQRFTGGSWVLVDCNQNYGGPARRSGVPLKGSVNLQSLIAEVNAKDNPLNITHEWAHDHLDSHWQPSIGVNEWGVQEWGEGFKVVVCDPMNPTPIQKDEYVPVGRMIKSAFGGMVQDTGNGLATPLNDGAFELCNVPIHTGRADDGESLYFLDETLKQMRSIDEEKANSGLIVINASRAEDYAEEFADKFNYDPGRVLFVPHHNYLVNGRDSVNGNVVRLDMVNLEVLVSQMRVAHRCLQIAAVNNQATYAKRSETSNPPPNQTLYTA